MIKVALIGYGYLGKFHAQKAESIDACELSAIVEPNLDIHQTIKENFPQVKIVQQINEVINLIDAALIVTPTSFHFELINKLIKHNIHIFCEKPIVANSDQAVELEQIAKDLDIVIQVGHSERYHNIWSEFKEDLSLLGQNPLHWYAIRAGVFKDRAKDVSVIDDLMIHDLDLVNMFTQSPLKNINTNHFKIRTDNIDHSVTNLSFENNDSATLISSRNFTEERREFWVSGSKGTLYVDLMNKVYRKSLKEYPIENLVNEKKYEPADHLMLEQKDFYNCIIEKSKPKVDLNQGCKIVHWLDQIKNN
ncbi:Gfo/Idh/MocA family oxidoreductase [Bacteriovoracaceae bacterium]|nr:Gfo/Idh/MocA family oxidoreductase [Bacteriovoracaceae bacterium]